MNSQYKKKVLTFNKILFFTIIILTFTLPISNGSACYFEDGNIKDNGVKRLAIILPCIIPERQEVTLKIISVIDYKDKMELDFDRSDKVNVSVLWSSASYLNGGEKSVLVQLEEGSAEVSLVGYMAEAIVLKAEWVSGESYMETWMTTAWVGVDPPK